MDYLVNNFRDRNAGIAYVYCDYKDSERQTVRNLISSLTRQLVDQCTDIPREAEKLFQKCLKEDRPATLNEHVSLLLSISSSFAFAYIIIDALDECPEYDTKDHEIRQLFIAKLKELEPFVNLFITSRSHLDLQQEFGKISPIDIRANDLDVKAYLISRISDYPRLSRFIDQDPKLKDIITDTVFRNAGGMYV